MAGTGRGAGGGAGSMQEELDGTLLYYMSCRESEAARVVSDQAWVEFHKRHAAVLFRYCQRACRSLGVAVDKAGDLLSYTLLKAADRAGTFVDGTDPATRAKRTQAWLGTIARNLLHDGLRNPHRPGPFGTSEDVVALEDLSDTELAAGLCDGKRFSNTQDAVRVIAAALRELDGRSRAVLAFTVLERRRSPKGSYTYRGSAPAFAKHLGTTPENLRQIRMKAFKELGAYLKAKE